VSGSAVEEENARLRAELEHCQSMLRIESQSRALLERQASSAESLIDELSAAVRARELSERRELVMEVELKDRTIAALQTEVDWLMSRFIAANATLGQLSNERAQIAHSNEQAQLELDVLRARLSEEETAFQQLAESKKMLVEELETLTQSLFEEANALVSTEARERFAADTERARLDRALAAKELELRISQELLIELSRTIESRGAAASARALTDEAINKSPVRSAPLPVLPAGGAVRRRSMNGTGQAVLANLVDDSTGPLASIHISHDNFPAPPSFADVFAGRRAPVPMQRRNRPRDADNDGDDNNNDDDDGGRDCCGIDATPAREFHRTNPYFCRILQLDVVPCLNPFSDDSELASVNVSLVRVLFGSDRQKHLHMLLESIFARQCNVDRLSVAATQNVVPCAHCRHVRDCGYSLRVFARPGRPICKPCRIRITAVQQYVVFVERIRCAPDSRMTISEAYAAFSRHRIAMHVARILCPTESLPSSVAQQRSAQVASADWLAGASADDAFFSFVTQ
jgi:hypothetical protein